MWKCTTSNSRARFATSSSMSRRRERVAARAVEPERPRPYGHETAGGSRIAAGKQRHVVAKPDELVRQICDNAFRTTIQLRRHALSQWCDLCDSHDSGVSICNRCARLRARMRASHRRAANLSFVLSRVSCVCGSAGRRSQRGMIWVRRCRAVTFSSRSLARMPQLQRGIEEQCFGWYFWQAGRHLSRWRSCAFSKRDAHRAKTSMSVR